ncbi:hypothetical protein HDV04_001334 [Boothiomyces sp. JEL0838]|nr:hypothetical protein HDV04_001334 [Boothiomyces sp. JEL0838]
MDGDQLIAGVRQVPDIYSTVLFYPITIRPGQVISQEELNTAINQYNHFYKNYLGKMYRLRFVILGSISLFFGTVSCFLLFSITEQHPIHLLIGGIVGALLFAILGYYSTVLKPQEELEQNVFLFTDRLNKEYSSRGLMFQLTKLSIGQIERYSNGRYQDSSAINAYQLQIFWSANYMTVNYPPTAKTQ